MSDPLDQLTPDESLRADNQIKLLKLELEHNVQFESFDEETPPEVVGDFLDGILALEEMQKNPQETPVYDLIGRPPFRPETDLTDSEVTQALDKLLKHMSEHGIELGILAPDDYDDRTIYRFVTDELFSHETTHMGGGWRTNFIYEEFHPNHRYDVLNRAEEILSMLEKGDFNTLSPCLDDHFFDRKTESWSFNARPEVTACLNDLIESWWPRLLRGGSVSDVQIAENAETAQATLVLQLGIQGNDDYSKETGTAYLRRSYDWWSVERITFGNWELA